MPTEVVDTSSTSEALLKRRQTVIRWALGASWAWLLPLAVVTAVAAYASLLFTSFTAEALNGQVTAWATLLAIALPTLALLVSAVAGFVTASVAARGLLRVRVLARVHSWVVGLGAALLGALVAVTVFWAFMVAANSIGTS